MQYVLGTNFVWVLLIGLVLGNGMVHTPVFHSDNLKTASVSDVQTLFPLGVFEDGNIVGGDTKKFETMLKDLQAHGLNSILFVNNTAKRDAPLLTMADQYGFNIFMMPNGDLNATWWSTNIPASAELAEKLAQPIVDLWGTHPSLAGYLVRDEPTLSEIEKVTLMTQAFRKLDPGKPVITTLIGLNRIAPIFVASQPDVMQLDVYPAAKNNPPCDFTMNGFGYPQHDFVSYIRAATTARSPDTPLWLILQTHSFDAGGASLRTPLPTEVRLQQWLAIGEGATGIFWFVYSTQQSWVGLADNPALYTEVQTQMQRLLPLRSLLLNTHKVSNRFTVNEEANAYVSTLESKDSNQTFVIAVNRDCQHEQRLWISKDQTNKMLRDVETGKLYRLDEAITFQPGDGKIFELVNVTYLSLLQAYTNIDEAQHPSLSAR